LCDSPMPALSTTRAVLGDPPQAHQTPFACGDQPPVAQSGRAACEAKLSWTALGKPRRPRFESGQGDGTLFSVLHRIAVQRGKSVGGKHDPHKTQKLDAHTKPTVIPNPVGNREERRAAEKMARKKNK